MARWLVADGCSHQSGGVVDVGSLTGTEETRKEGKARETWQQPEPLQRSKQLPTTRLNNWITMSNHKPQTGAIRETIKEHMSSNPHAKQTSPHQPVSLTASRLSYSTTLFSLMQVKWRPTSAYVSPIPTDNASRRPFEISLLHDRSPLGTPLWLGWMLRPLKKWGRVLYQLGDDRSLYILVEIST